jgi:hypothetical protein
MSNKKLIILGAVAVIMVLLTVVQSYLSNGPVRTMTMDSPLIQGLKTADIDRITLGPPDKMLTLKKRGDQFYLVEKDNYPASLQQINNLITSSLDIRIKELVTDSPKNFKDLDLTQDTATSVIKFLNAEEALITGIMVGKRDEMAKGDYVRLVSADQDMDKKAYLSINVPRMDMTALSYLDKSLFKTEKQTISKVTVIGPEGRYTISSGKDNKITLDNIPEGKKVKETIYEGVFSAATDLTFSDVEKESAETRKLDFKNTYICFLKNTGVYTFKLAEKDDKTYISVSSDFTDKEPVRVKKGIAESDEQLKKKEAKLLAREASLKYNKRHRGWVYQIPSWKAIDMTRKLEDLIEDENAGAKN